MRRANVVHEQQVARLPPLAYRVCLVHLVDQLDDIRTDRIAVAETRIEREPVLAIDVHEVLAHLGGQRPPVQEGDLVEPAPPAGGRVTHDGAAALPGAQPTALLPLEPDV